MNASLQERLATGLLAHSSLETRQRLAREASWFSLPGGALLYDAGEAADGVYIILTGRLVIVRPDPDGDGPEVERIIGYCRAGDPLAEMSILNDDVHRAAAVALRDCEILKIPHGLFDELFESDAGFASAIGRVLAHRARYPKASFQRAGPRVFALIASSPSIDIGRVAAQIADELRSLGKRCALLGEGDLSRSTQALESIEDSADIVLLPCSVGGAPLYRFALRHADRFFVFARRDARPPNPLPLSPTPDSPARRFRLVDLVVVHEGQSTGAVGDWARAVDAARIFHWTPPGGSRRSVSRLTRALAGLTVGLVLSGGGARAYAHIGAVRALFETGAPVDFVAATSMGAIVGACVAMGWGREEIEERIKDSFVSSNPLADHVLPVVALTRGRLVDERLERHFGDIKIEEMQLPFLCVSTDLTSGAAYVHRRGLLREALRASIALPGVLPPVVTGEAVLVDGAVVNNFPIDYMANWHRGVTIGVDVSRRATFSADPYRSPPGFFGWMRRHGLRAAPPIVPLLMRTATVHDDEEPGRPTPDILATPDVAGVQLRDWRKYEHATREGYEEMSRILEEKLSVLSPIIDAAAPRDL